MIVMDGLLSLVGERSFSLRLLCFTKLDTSGKVLNNEDLSHNPSTISCVVTLSLLVSIQQICNLLSSSTSVERLRQYLINWCEEFIITFIHLTISTPL